MSRISKKKLGYFVSSKISDQFVDTLVNLNSKNKGKEFVNELFTETEKMMLAKRLGAIAMLKDGYSNYRVSRHLQMSSSTVFNLSKDVKKNQYSFLEDFFSNKKVRTEFLKKVLYYSRGGLPSRTGRDRWNFLNPEEPDEDQNIR
ncbi:MAG: Trp family transcriptional regulator [bacterium]